MFLGLALSVVNESTIICWHRSIKTQMHMLTRNYFLCSIVYILCQVRPSFLSLLPWQVSGFSFLAWRRDSPKKEQKRIQSKN